MATARSKLDEIVESFSTLEDPRSHINRRHPLPSILVIAVLAVLAGAAGPTAIARWAALKEDLLTRILDLPHGIPGKDVFRRVLMLLKPEAFEAAFNVWIDRLRDEAVVATGVDRPIIAIDGKSARRSHDANHDLGVLHVVTAWAGEYGLALGQEVCAEKSNENTAIPELLKKIDVRGGEWIAQLLQHGLLRPSFIPPRPTRELRDLTRQRTQLIRERTTVVNRIQKTLEDANIKLGSVASNALGVSGRLMIEAIIRGEYDPVRLADLARSRLRKKTPALQQALRGGVTQHHRFLLQTEMNHLDHLERLILQYSARIEEALAPFATALARLVTIPGVDFRVAEVIVAEIGLDMSQFPTAGHLSSWAGLASGNHESAGKRRAGRTTPGNTWLKTALVQAAWAAFRAKRTHLSRKFRRVAGSRGKKRAAMHTILIIAYRLLKEGTSYEEIAGDSAAA